MRLKNKHTKTPLVICGQYLINPGQSVEVPREIFDKYRSVPAGKYYADKFLEEVFLSKRKKETKISKKVKIKTSRENT